MMVRICTDFKLPHLVMDVAFTEMLDIGKLQVHLCQPHQNSVPRPLKLLPLRSEVLCRTEQSSISNWICFCNEVLKLIMLVSSACNKQLCVFVNACSCVA